MLGGKLKRGVGGTVGAVLAIIVVISVALYIYSNMPKPPTVFPDPVLRVLDEYLSQRVLIGPAAGEYYIINAGSSTVVVEYLVLRDASRGSIVLARAGTNSACSVAKPDIQPGETSAVKCRGELTLVAIVSSEGRVFIRDPRLTTPYFILRSLPQRVLLTSVVASALEHYIENVDQVRVSTPTPLVKLDAYSKSGVEVRVSVNASLVIALRSPSLPDAWNILIVGYGAYGSRSGSSLVVGSTPPLNLSRAGALRFRIKIENLSASPGGGVTVGGSTLTLPGIFPCFINYGRQCWVEVSGAAGKVSVYVNGTLLNVDTDLYPYYITGDLDGNGYPEVFFITQDFGVGSSLLRNDAVTVSTGASAVAVDSTARPIRIVFAGTSVNNSKYATAVVSVKLAFWDNSGDDILDNDNRVILRVGLYDPGRSKYVYSVNVSYFELCRYRIVRPMAFSYVTRDFLLYVPPPWEIGSKDLFIAVDILDPYYLEGVRNDADIILAVEYVGLTLGVRL